MLQNLILRWQRIASRMGYDIRRVMSLAKERSLYRNLYSASDLKCRAFVNIGAGGFRHPFWTNVDHASKWYSNLQASGQVEWDIMSMSPCPVEPEQMNVVYSSHTIEHITDVAAHHMFKEAHGMLKSGGTFRVTAPDADVLYGAYKRGDELFFYNEHGGDSVAWIDASIEEKLVYCFASQRVKFHPEVQSGSVLNPEKIASLFSERSLSEALDQIVSCCSCEIQMRHPGNHINWWNYSKVEDFMKSAGFRGIRRSEYGQSHCPVLRNTAYFDNTRPRISFYIEAVK
ncbi:MAG: methyltransferase domain-containing protein [Spirochaetales bacterium]|nr:methyltransferase domain-containing protein [Spirochaetales bacterium]